MLPVLYELETEVAAQNKPPLAELGTSLAGGLQSLGAELERAAATPERFPWWILVLGILIGRASR